jgi:hypothetical protein
LAHSPAAAQPLHPALLSMQGPAEVLGAGAGEVPPPDGCVVGLLPPDCDEVAGGRVVVTGGGAGGGAGGGEVGAAVTPPPPVPEPLIHPGVPAVHVAKVEIGGPT